MSELIIANVVIADRTYRIKVSAEEEEVLRKTAKLLNDKILHFKENFAGKDMQDYVSMALLWFATEQNKTGADQFQEQATLQKLITLENLLDKYIAEL